MPSEDWSVAGVEGDRYRVGPQCAAPGCKRWVDHSHHLWRRSHLGGNYWWVRVPSGEVLRNVVGLCWHHHQDVTGDKGGHKAWIKWAGGSTFIWLEMRSTDGKWQQTGTLSLPAPTPEAVPAGSPGREAERCPTCGRLQRKSEPEHEHEPSPKRPRKTWTIQVPADQEDGAAVLDELVEMIGDLIGTGEYTSSLRRYHTIVPALYWVLQNAEQFAADLAAVEAG